MPAWRLQDTTERFTDSCGVCAAGREHPAMASPSWSLSTPNPKLLGPGGRRWRLHLSLSGNAVPIVWLPETATRSSGHPFQNRSYCRVVLGSFPIRPPADFGLAFASNLFDWKCYNCGDVAWALRSLGAAIASVWVCVCVSVCLSGWAVGSLCCTCSSCVEVSWCGKFGVTLSAPVKQKPCWISSKSWVAPLWPMCWIWCQLLHHWETNTTIGTTVQPIHQSTTKTPPKHPRQHGPWSITETSPRPVLDPKVAGPVMSDAVLGNVWTKVPAVVFREAPGYWGTLNRERTE